MNLPQKILLLSLLIFCCINQSLAMGGGLKMTLTMANKLMVTLSNPAVASALSITIGGSAVSKSITNSPIERTPLASSSFSSTCPLTLTQTLTLITQSQQANASSTLFRQLTAIDIHNPQSVFRVTPAAITQQFPLSPIPLTSTSSVSLAHLPTYSFQSSLPLIQASEKSFSFAPTATYSYSSAPSLAGSSTLTTASITVPQLPHLPDTPAVYTPSLSSSTPVPSNTDNLTALPATTPNTHTNFRNEQNVIHQNVGFAQEIAKMEAYHRALSQESARIFSDRHLYNQYLKELDSVKNHLDTVCRVSDHPSVIKKQLEVTALGISHAFKNEEVQITKLNMERILAEPNGKFRGCLSSDDCSELYKFKSTYMDGIANTRNAFTATYGWLKDKAQGIDYSNIDQKFRNNSYNQHLYQLCCAWENKDVAQAQLALGRIKPMHLYDKCSECMIYNHMNRHVKELHQSIYNEHNIKHIYTQDPLWQSCKETLHTYDPHYATTRNTIDFHLQMRHEIVQPIFKKIGDPATLPPSVKNLCYELTYKVSDPTAVTDHLASLKLSNDHPNPEIRQLFNTVYDTQHMVSKFHDHAHLNAYQDIVMPASLGSQSNIPLRVLSEKLHSLQITSEQEKTLVRQGLFYIREACSNSQQAATYKTLAESVYTSLTVPRANTDIWRCGNLAEHFPDQQRQSLQYELAQAAAQAYTSQPMHSTIGAMAEQHGKGIFSSIENARTLVQQGQLTRAEYQLNSRIKPHIRLFNESYDDYSQALITADTKEKLPPFVVAALAAALSGPSRRYQASEAAAYRAVQPAAVAVISISQEPSDPYFLNQRHIQKIKNTNNNPINNIKNSNDSHHEENQNKKDAKKSDSTSEIPSFIKENRVPMDQETILKSGEFQKTNMRVKGAAVYQKGDRYYHRDTFHAGRGAHLEVYNQQGRHLGKANPLTGELILNTMNNNRWLPK